MHADAPRGTGEWVPRARSIPTEHPENAAIATESAETAKNGAACAHRCLGPQAPRRRTALRPGEPARPLPAFPHRPAPACGDGPRP